VPAARLGQLGPAACLGHVADQPKRCEPEEIVAVIDGAEAAQREQAGSRLGVEVVARDDLHVLRHSRRYVVVDQDGRETLPDRLLPHAEIGHDQPRRVPRGDLLPKGNGPWRLAAPDDAQLRSAAMPCQPARQNGRCRKPVRVIVPDNQDLARAEGREAIPEERVRRGRIGRRGT
jgi:hypothetical protein